MARLSNSDQERELPSGSVAWPSLPRKSTPDKETPDQCLGPRPAAAIDSTSMGTTIAKQISVVTTSRTRATGVDHNARLRSVPTANHRGMLVRCIDVGPDPYGEFTAFAQACQPRLLRAAYLICRDVHLAEDLLQAALVKVALRWSRLRDGQPEAYARTVLYRDAVSWWRRQRREVTMAQPPEPQPAAEGDEIPLRLLLARALARLTPKQRAVLVLRFFEDHTEARTAQVLGVSVGTVKSQTAVALRRLREMVPELEELGGAQGGSTARSGSGPRGGSGAGRRVVDNEGDRR